MSNAAGESSDCFHFLGLLQLLAAGAKLPLRQFVPGDVADGAGDKRIAVA